jgi:hypothetical protein
VVEVCHLALTIRTAAELKHGTLLDQLMSAFRDVAGAIFQEKVL